MQTYANTVPWAEPEDPRSAPAGSCRSDSPPCCIYTSNTPRWSCGGGEQNQNILTSLAFYEDSQMVEDVQVLEDECPCVMKPQSVHHLGFPVCIFSKRPEYPRPVCTYPSKFHSFELRRKYFLSSNHTRNGLSTIRATPGK